MRRFTLVALVALLAVAAPALAQNPPNTWHPYRGGTNCVQVADANGNFNCSSLVTIDPATGVLSISGGSGIVNTVLGALVVAPSGNGLTYLGNDVVLYKRTTTAVAPTGPGNGGVTLRVRPGAIPGSCRLVVIAGSSFGAQYEFPIAFLDPAAPFPASAGTAGPNTMYGRYTVDLPGGPRGC